MVQKESTCQVPALDSKCLAPYGDSTVCCGFHAPTPAVSLPQ